MHYSPFRIKQKRTWLFCLSTFPLPSFMTSVLMAPSSMAMSIMRPSLSRPLATAKNPWRRLHNFPAPAFSSYISTRSFRRRAPLQMSFMEYFSDTNHASSGLQQYQTEVEADEGRRLLDPHDILRDLQNHDSTTINEIDPTQPKIPLPTHLSPTSLDQFQRCPQAFFFLYILKLKSDPPITPELARGIICHKALEDVFDLRPEERSLMNLENLFRKEWGEKRGDRDNNNSSLIENTNEDGENVGGSEGKKKEGIYDNLFRTATPPADGDDDEKHHSLPSNSSYDIEEEIKWGKYALHLLKNYYELEDPKNVQNPNPLMKEMWVQARFPFNDNEDTEDEIGHAGNDFLSGTNRDDTSTNSENGGNKDNRNGSFVVRGKIDRIDIFPDPSNNKLQLNIIDYKTGKKPNFKYSPSVNERIENEQFWKMKVYALILWKMILQTENNMKEIISQKNGGNQRNNESNQQYKYAMSWTLQQKLLQVMGETNSRQKWSNIIKLNSLRLLYLTSHLDDVSTGLQNSQGSVGKAAYLDYSLGSTPSEFQSILDQTQHEIQSIGREITHLVEIQDPKAFKHCDWKYCSCHEMRGRFRGGTVWSRERDGNTGA